MGFLWESASGSVKLKSLEKFYNLPFYMSSLNSVNNIQNNNGLTNIKNMDKFLKYDVKEKKYLYKRFFSFRLCWYCNF